MKILFSLLILTASVSFAAKSKPEKRQRSPSSVQCEALFQMCVSNSDIDKRAYACKNAVAACKNRFTNQDSENYSKLEKKCADIEKSSVEFAELRADFCRNALVQYILSN